jgi:hypothetical protein
MKTYPETVSAERAASGREIPARGAWVAKAKRVLGDLVLLALFVGLIFLFLSKNGFIGTSDIQPYPY